MLIPAPWPSWPPALGPQLPLPSAKGQGVVGRLQNRYLCPRLPLRWVIKGWWLPCPARHSSCWEVLPHSLAVTRFWNGCPPGLCRPRVVTTPPLSSAKARALPVFSPPASFK